MTWCNSFSNNLRLSWSDTTRISNTYNLSLKIWGEKTVVAVPLVRFATCIGMMRVLVVVAQIAAANWNFHAMMGQQIHYHGWVAVITIFGTSGSSGKRRWVLWAVAPHLEHDPQYWFLKLDRDRPHMDWEEFKDHCHRRFGAFSSRSKLGELVKLQQTGSVKEYHRQFEKLAARTSHLHQNKKWRFSSMGCKTILQWK